MIKSSYPVIPTNVSCKLGVKECERGSIVTDKGARLCACVGMKDIPKVAKLDTWQSGAGAGRDRQTKD